MEKVTTHLDGRQLTYEDIRARKREVLSQIHEQQQVMRQCVGELADDFTNTGNLMSAKGIQGVRVDRRSILCLPHHSWPFAHDTSFAPALNGILEHEQNNGH